MNRQLDLLLVNAPGKARVYQSLADDLAAYEPPIWATLIAGFARRRGLGVEILDGEALGLTPLLTVFTVYGQQPSASTQCMPAAGVVARLVKDADPSLRTLFLGTHPSALPQRTLEEEATDFVCEGEGPLTIAALIHALCSNGDLSNVPGLWWRENGVSVHSAPEPAIKDLDATLGGFAWDLLPMSRYRAHNWHCWDHIHDRGAYASIYTSLGCPYRCTFCCINAPFGGASIRYFSADTIIREIDALVQQYGIRNLKIADEMFVLNQRHVLSLCDLLIERNYDLNIWAYARVDTVHEKFLDKLKRAGVNWLGVGIESASRFVRDGVDKGRFGDDKIAAIVARIRSAGIYVGANYIFGLPDDTLETMQQTLDMAIELNTEWANFYSAMAYPGSALHAQATTRGVRLPEDPGGPGWIGYSQHAYETLPLATDTVPAGKVLSFRDRAFDTYFTGERYLSMMATRFGPDVVDHLNAMTKHSLRRQYAEPLDDWPQPASACA
jgi:anaerobic magnesium-protoporphyrin IX monomethyl ester cyclase